MYGPNAFLYEMTTYFADGTAPLYSQFFSEHDECKVMYIQILSDEPLSLPQPLH